MAKRFSVSSTGDSLFIKDFPKEYQGQLDELKDFFGSVDFKFTNLETNLTDYEYFPNQFSGGTWLNTRRECILDLNKFGFDVYGTANNHSLDYGHLGLVSTIKTLDEYGLKHCGSGESLEQAERPVYLEKDGVKVAVIAVDCVLENATMAGKETLKLKSRPGVNFLRKVKTFKVDKNQLIELKKIASDCKINFDRDNLIVTGFVSEEKDGVFVFGNTRFTDDASYPTTKCNKSDLNRIIGKIREAKTNADYLFVLPHCHDNDDVSHANPAEFLKEFARVCIDNGADAIFGGGCHELRGIEVYKNRPIFYSLGDFIYQGMDVEILPADFLEKYGVDKNGTAKEGLDARSKGGKIGLQTDIKNFLTVLPKLEFEEGKLADFKLLPIELNFNDKVLFGLPTVAKGEYVNMILDTLNKISAQFGTKFKIDNGYIVLA